MMTISSPSEADVQKAVFEYLVLRGFLVLRINSGRKGHVAFVRWQAQGCAGRNSGVSDILALAPSGRLYAIECKAPGEEAQAHQSEFLGEAARRGAVAVVADSLDKLIRVVTET